MRTLTPIDEPHDVAAAARAKIKLIGGTMSQDVADEVAQDCYTTFDSNGSKVTYSLSRSGLYQG